MHEGVLRVSRRSACGRSVAVKVSMLWIPGSCRPAVSRYWLVAEPSAPDADSARGTNYREQRHHSSERLDHTSRIGISTSAGLVTLNMASLHVRISDSTEQSKSPPAVALLG